MANIQFKSLAGTISRFSAITFLVIVVGGLVCCVILLDKTLDQTAYTNNSQPSSTSNNVVVSQSTIDELAKLNTYDENLTTKTLPSGRINPFSE